MCCWINIRKSIKKSCRSCNRYLNNPLFVVRYVHGVTVEIFIMHNALFVSNLNEFRPPRVL